MSGRGNLAFLSEYRTDPRNRATSAGTAAIASEGVPTPSGAAVLTRYVTHLSRRRLSPNTIRLRTYYMTTLQVVHPDLLVVTTSDLEHYVQAHPNWSENTEATAVASWRSFYGWAERVGLVDESPTTELGPVRVARRPGRIASDAQILAALGRAENDADVAMLLLGAECGLRASEIAGLRVEDLNGSWLTVLGKGNKVRSLSASPELLAVLHRLGAWARWGYYFPGRSGGHVHPSTVWRHIDRLLESNPHSLRHRAATACYEGTGHDLRATQEFLGHANIHTTELYVHVGKDALRRAAAATRIASAA